MTHAMAGSATTLAKPAVADAIHRAHIMPSDTRNSARTLEAVVAMRNRAPPTDATLRMSNCALTMSTAGMLRHFIRSMGAAHDLAELKTGIVGNLPPTLTRSESRHDLPKAVTSGFGQQVGLLQSAETEPRLRLLPGKSMDRDSGLIRDLL